MKNRISKKENMPTQRKSSDWNEQSYYKRGRTEIRGNDMHSTCLKYINMLWPKVMTLILLILYLNEKLPLQLIWESILRQMHFQ